MKKKPPGPGSLVVDTVTLARYFGVSQRTIRHWGKVEALPKLAQNKYSLVEVRLWEIRRLEKEIAEQQVDDKRLKRYSADEREHRSELLRMRMLKMQGLLVDRKEVERKTIEQIVAVKGGLKMLEDRLCGRIEGDGVRGIVEEEIELVCLRWAGKDEIEAAVNPSSPGRLRPAATGASTAGATGKLRRARRKRKKI